MSNSNFRNFFKELFESWRTGNPSESGDSENSFYSRIRNSGAGDDLHHFLANTHFSQEEIRAISSLDHVHTIADLSNFQLQVFLKDQIEQSSIAFNIPFLIEIDGTLNIKVLQHAIKEMIKRHSVLRSFLIFCEDTPMQVVLEDISFNLDIQKVDSKNVLEERIQKESQTPIPLTHPPLSRFVLYRLHTTKHVLQITLHHMIADRISLQILFDEILNLYQLKSKFKFFSAGMKPLGFTDFTNQLRITDAQNDKGLSFWNEYLSGRLHKAKIYLQPKNGANTELNGGVVYKNLDKSRLQDYCNQQNMSLFQYVLSCFLVFLRKYDQRDDLVIGIPFSTRNDIAMDQSIGPFIQMLPYRDNLSKYKNSDELFNGTKKHIAGILSHQNVSVEYLTELMNSESDEQASKNLDYPIVFTFQPKEVESKTLDNLVFTPQLISNKTSKTDLTFYVNDNEDQLNFHLEFNTSLYQKSDAEMLLEDFISVLSKLLHKTNIKSSNILKPNDDAKQYAVGPTLRLPKTTILHEFQKRVQEDPEKTAAIFDDPQGQIQISYSTLDSRSNQLARLLVEQSPQTEHIAIVLERSLDLIIAYIGILKAKKVVLPIDTELPKKRISNILEQSETNTILTHRRFDDLIEKNQDTKVFYIEEHPYNNSENSEITNKYKETDQKLPAYLIFTSGSTGVPKGVLTSHHSLINRLLWMKDAYDVGKETIIMQKTSISFDVSVWELLLPFISGSTLVLAKPQGHRDNPYMIDLIERTNVTMLHFVPTMLHAFLDEMKGEQCSSLTNVISSGELLNTRTGLTFSEKLKAASLHNLYGPTEAAIDVTAFTWNRSSTYTSIPIGKPINNTTIYLLDENKNKVPKGEIGEIYIGGYNVGIGYINNEEETQKRFVQNPFDEGRLFKTGDHARLLDDGNILFIGRIDHQVKINGFRVEIPEIEYRLSKYEDILECAVGIKKRTNQQYLIAYIAKKQHASLDLNSLQNYLLEYLPSYMIPNRIVLLAELPYLTSGKIDRKKLALLEDEESINSSSTQPESKIEQVLCAIWQDVLELPNLGVNDNFFLIGGNSINSIRIVYLSKKAGIQYTLQDIFEHKSIRNLVVELSLDFNAATEEESYQPFDLIPFEVPESWKNLYEDALPLLELQKVLIHESEYNSSYSSYVTSYLIKAVLDINLLKQAVQKLIQKHSVLRTSIDLSTYEIPIQLVHEDAHPKIHLIDYSTLPEGEIDEQHDEWLRQIRRQKFEWDAPPLFEIYVHFLDKNTFWLSVIDPILDGWSVTLLSSELFLLYQELLKGNNTSITKLPVLSSYYRLEQEAIHSVALNTFWESYLAKAKATHLSTWHGDIHTAKSRSFVRKEVVIDSNISDALKEIAHRLHIPIKTVLLAVHLRTLAHLTNQESITTGVVTNNRMQTEFGSNQIGLFLNFLPLHIELSRGSWTDFILRVFEAEKQIIDKRNLPHTRMPRTTSNQLFYDTVFNYTNFYPYSNTDNEEQWNILRTKALDQTYFFLTCHFSLDWKSQNLKLFLEFNSAHPDSIHSISKKFEKALASLVSNFELPIVQQSLLLDEETIQINALLNTSQKNNVEKTIHGIILENTQKYPEVVAIDHLNEKITYRELEEKISQTSHYILDHGEVYGKSICLYLKRSSDWVIAAISILKIGALIVPLDLDWPVERLKSVLQLANPAFIVHNEESAHIKEIASNTYTLVNLKNTQFDAHNTNLIDLKKNDDAYILFTSGTTAKPKMITGSHKGIVNRFQWQQSTYPIKTAEICAQKTKLTFIDGLNEILLTLMASGTLTIIDDDITKDVFKFIELLHEKQISRMTLVPSQLKILVAAQQGIPSLQVLISSGESLPPTLANESLELFPDAKIINLYGSTEVSGDITAYELERKVKRLQTVPIGFPIWNTKIKIIDVFGNPNPFFTPGELFVSGAGVNVSSTEQEHNFKNLQDENTDKSETYFAMGDWARLLPNGLIEMVGRTDQQHKIRGVRINLLEIQSVISSLSLVKSCVVINHKKEDRFTLIAFVVMNEKEASKSNLKVAISEVLTSYQMPERFIFIDSIPLNENGKIHYKILETMATSEAEFKPLSLPKTDMEQLLASMWATVLQVDISAIGRETDFLNQGGHSIKVLELSLLIQKRLAIKIASKDILKHAQLKDLADYIESIILDLY